MNFPPQLGAAGRQRTRHFLPLQTQRLCQPLGTQTPRPGGNGSSPESVQVQVGNYSGSNDSAVSLGSKWVGFSATAFVTELKLNSGLKENKVITKTTWGCGPWNPVLWPPAPTLRGMGPPGLS